MTIMLWCSYVFVSNLRNCTGSGLNMLCFYVSDGKTDVLLNRELSEMYFDVMKRLKIVFSFSSVLMTRQLIFWSWI